MKTRNKDEFILYNERFFHSLMKRGMKLKAYKKYMQVLKELKKKEQTAPQLVL